MGGRRRRKADSGAGLVGEPAEALAPPPGPVEAWVAAIGEVSETTFQEVFGGEPGDGVVVRRHPRDGGNLARGANVDRRQAQAANRFGHGRRLDPGENAVAVPARQRR